MERPRQKLYEDEAYVLDVFPPRRLVKQTYHDKSMHIAQMLGTEYFTLLEATVNPTLGLKAGMKTYIGKDVPRDMLKVTRRLTYQELTENAKYELEKIVEQIVHEREARFVDFINNCSALTPRLHSLEALPGIGKKITLKILEEREKQPFTSYDDIRSRTGIQDIDKILVRRIIIELSDPNNRHWLFVRSPTQSYAV